MKIRTRLGIVVTSLLLAALTTLSGCATTGLQRSDKTGASMKTVEQDIQKASLQVDFTAVSLQDLIRPDQPDLRKAFISYGTEVDKMEHLGQVLFHHVDRMSALGKNYFDEWQKQGDAYTNPEIESLSEQRRNEMNTFYVKISDASVGVNGAAKAYLSNLRQIRSYLSNDLTPEGVGSITAVARQAVTEGENLKAAVTPVLNAIEVARAQLSHGTVK